MATDLPYADPTADEAIANVMHDETTHDTYTQSWAETVLHMITSPHADNDDITYLIRTIAPRIAA